MLCSQPLELESLASGTLMVGHLGIWPITGLFFTSFEDFNGGKVTFSDDSIACVKGKGSVSIP